MLRESFRSHAERQGAVLCVWFSRKSKMLQIRSKIFLHTITRGYPRQKKSPHGKAPVTLQRVRLAQLFKRSPLVVARPDAALWAASPGATTSAFNDVPEAPIAPKRMQWRPKVLLKVRRKRFGTRWVSINRSVTSTSPYKEPCRWWTMLPRFLLGHHAHDPPGLRNQRMTRARG